jgi:hypothetical protein
MQARRRHLVEPPKPGNIDRRKGFMDIIERLTLGVIAVSLTDVEPAQDIRTGTRVPALKPRTQRTY